jgi:hypothetical protein
VRQFLLGVASTLAALLVVALVLLLSLGSGAPPGTPSPATSTVPPGVRLEPPQDLAAGETWIGSVVLDGEDLVAPEGDLSVLEATGAGVRFDGNGMRAARLDLDVTIPFATIAAQVGPDTRVYAVSGGRAGVERQVTILGRDLTVRATGRVTADGGQLLIEPESVDLGGPAFVGAAVSAIARTLVTIRQPVPGVPEGMTLTDVSVSGAGVAASLTGTDVVIGR